MRSHLLKTRKILVYFAEVSVDSDKEKTSIVTSVTARLRQLLYLFYLFSHFLRAFSYCIPSRIQLDRPVLEFFVRSSVKKECDSDEVL